MTETLTLADGSEIALAAPHERVVLSVRSGIGATAPAVHLTREEAEHLRDHLTRLCAKLRKAA